MYETHTTKEGDKMLIAQMDDNHLINTIKLKCRKLEECRKQIEGIRDFKGSSLLSILNTEFSKENAIEQLSYQIKSIDKQLQPYVMEACLRCLKIGIYLKQAYGRDEAIPISNVKLLQSSEDDDDDDFEEMDDAEWWENDPRCEPEYRN